MVKVSTEGTTQKLVSATRYQGVRATGITPVGHGVDLAITQIGTKGEKSSAFTVLGNLVNGSLSDILPYVEVWKEVP